MKFGCNQPSSFRGEVVWNCGPTDDGRTTDNGACLYYKLPRSLRLRWAKNLDRSYMMDLDIWDCFEKKINLSYSHRNTIVSKFGTVRVEAYNQYFNLSTMYDSCPIFYFIFFFLKVKILPHRTCLRRTWWKYLFWGQLWRQTGGRRSELNP